MSAWPTAVLEDLAAGEPNSFVDGPFGSDLKTSEYVDVGVPLIRIQNVKPNRFLSKEIRFISEDKARQLSRHEYRPGDVVITKLGDPCGVACVVPAEAGRGIVVADIVRFRGDQGRIDHRFLSHFINSPIASSWVGREAKGTTRQRVNLSNFRRLPVPLPPLPEQRRIAEILDRADALRAKRRAAFAQLDTLTQCIFLEMFGDPRNNERGWPIRGIGSVISELRGGAALEPEDFVEQGCPILHKGAIKPGGKIAIDSKKKTFARWAYANANQKCFANRDCIAVTLRDLVPTGPSIGLAADLRKGPFDKYLLAQGAYAIKLDPNAITAEYFVHLSNMPNFRHVLRQNAVGSTQIHIRTPIYLAIRIPVPPVKVQQEFARRVATTEAVERVQRKSATRVEDLFAALQYRAFRGDL